MSECVIVGGGIIGLAIAEELAAQGIDAEVVEYQAAKHAASWAAAGILPPPVTRAIHDPLEQIRDLSHRIYPDWCLRLATSEKPVVLRRCGGIYLARTPGEQVALAAALNQWKTDGVRVDEWSLDELHHREPKLGQFTADTRVYFLPDELEVRPTRILKALRERLAQLKVPITRSMEPIQWVDGREGSAVIVNGRELTASRFVLACGPWTPQLLIPFGVGLPIEPRRGQMVMWTLSAPALSSIVNEGPRYLVARTDGQLLAGSTVEDVGFQDNTTTDKVDELIRFARELMPGLSVQPDQTWAGLRPMPFDGLPYLGSVPGCEQVYVATGHFRSGIHLAPATARLIGQLIKNQPTDISLLPFSIDR